MGSELREAPILFSAPSRVPFDVKKDDLGPVSIPSVAIESSSLIGAVSLDSIVAIWSCVMSGVQSVGFSKMALFSKEQLIELIYWRDSRKSGIVLGSVLAILLSLSIVSVVSVVSYASLSVLAITLSFRLYKNILQAVQKTSDGHPFKEYLEVDVTLPAEKVQEIADLSAARLNATLLELRRLFLVEDLVDSFKFGLALWALTYVGSWFNGITLVILAVVGVFSLPKVYETHQEKIDQNLEVIRVKVNEVVEKVQAVLPIGKKPKSQ